MSKQPELPIQTEAPLFEIREGHPNIDWLVRLLQGRGWMQSDEILREAKKPVTEYGRRWVRRLAQRSGGRVMSFPGSEGYRLLVDCTVEEFHHARNALKSQSDNMLKRVIEMDRIFYSRPTANPGAGILSPAGEEADFSI